MGSGRRVARPDSNLAAIRALYDRPMPAHRLQRIVGLTERSTYHLLDRLLREGVPVRHVPASAAERRRGGAGLYWIEPAELVAYWRGDSLWTIARRRRAAERR